MHLVLLGSGPYCDRCPKKQQEQLEQILENNSKQCSFVVRSRAHVPVIAHMSQQSSESRRSLISGKQKPRKNSKATTPVSSAIAVAQQLQPLLLHESLICETTTDSGENPLQRM